MFYCNFEAVHWNRYHGVCLSLRLLWLFLQWFNEGSLWNAVVTVHLQMWWFKMDFYWSLLWFHVGSLWTFMCFCGVLQNLTWKVMWPTTVIQTNCRPNFTIKPIFVRLYHCPFSFKEHGCLEQFCKKVTWLILNRAVDIPSFWVQASGVSSRICYQLCTPGFSHFRWKFGRF